MPIIEPVTLLYAAGVFFRAGTFLFLLPFFKRPVPVLIRVALAAFLAYSAVLLIPPSGDLVLPTHWLGLVVLALTECFWGFCMALGMLLLFHIVQAAGEVISNQIGLMQSNIFNPMSQQQESAFGTGMMMLTIVLIFVSNLHHQILYGFLESLRITPIGSVPGEATNIEYVLRETGKIFLVSLQMAGPVIAVNYIVTLSFAFLGRIVPTMNVLIMSFSLRLGLGFFILILVVYFLAQVLLSQIVISPERMLHFLPF